MLDVFSSIESVSADIQAKNNEVVEIAKSEHIQRVKEYYTNKNLNWADTGVNTDLSLHIIIEDKKFLY